MTSELVKCPHCGYQYRTNVEKIVEDGETIAVRLGFSDIEKISRRKTAKSFFINLKCPNVPKCGKEFEWEVQT